MPVFLKWLLPLLCVGIGFLLFMGMQGQSQPLEGVLVGRISDSASYQPLFTAEKNGWTYFAYSLENEAVCLVLDGQGGIVRQARFDGAAYTAGLRGDNLFFLTRREDKVEGVFYSSEDLTEKTRRTYPFSPDELLLADVDGEGNLYMVPGEAWKRVVCLGADGQERWRKDFPETLTFLGITEGSTLCVYGESGVLYYGNAQTLQDMKQSAGCVEAPNFLLGEGYFVDRTGLLCRYTEELAALLFRLPDSALGSLFYSLDGENCLILSNGLNEIKRLNKDGDTAQTYRINGNLNAVGKQGAVYRREENLYFFPYPKAESTATPGPSPSPSPSPTENPSNEQFTLEGDFLLAPVGSTVQELTAAYAPDIIPVFQENGKPVSSGRLATGMLAGDYTVVVLSDCNGSGTLTYADLRGAQELFLGEERYSKAAFRAVDMDGDGEISGADLVYLSRKLNEE